MKAKNTGHKGAVGTGLSLGLCHHAAGCREIPGRHETLGETAS